MKIAKKGKLYELSFDKKWKFMESLKKVKEKYTIESIDEEKIKDYLYFNKNNVLIEELKELAKLVKTKLEVEDRLFIIEQNEKATERRIEYMETDKKKMLNSILERENKKIIIDRIMKKNKRGEDEIIFKKKDVLRETNKHFKSMTDTQVKRKNELEQFWREEYDPREDIDENIYKDLLIDIKEEKWLTAIKNLNKNKAGGISQITYDILQECTYQLKNIMRKYYTWLIKIELMTLA